MRRARNALLGPATLAAVALVALACASSAERREPPRAPRDRTTDPEFARALEAAEREFETQADALAAGVYEPFVHPDSVRGDAPPGAPRGLPPEIDFGPDPTTEELLGTLPSTEPYNPTTSTEAAETPPPGGSAWTLQAGAFGAETGALVRLRQLARDFPGWPRWHVSDGGVVRVYVGRFATRGDADRAREAVAARGYSDAWVVRAP